MKNTPVLQSTLCCTQKCDAPRIDRGSAGNLAGGGIVPLAGVRPRINQRAAALPRDVPCMDVSSLNLAGARSSLPRLFWGVACA